MDRALIVGLTWLTCTAALSLVLGRVMLRADARQEQNAQAEQRARAAARVRWVAGPASGAGEVLPAAQEPPGQPARAAGDRGRHPNCALARPLRHGHPPTPRRPRGRGGA